MKFVLILIIVRFSLGYYHIKFARLWPILVNRTYAQKQVETVLQIYIYIYIYVFLFCSCSQPALT